jgi:CRP-like cAMP-binding protein
VKWPLFAGVPEHELRKLTHRRRFGRGEVVFHHGDPGESVHLVESGHFVARTSTPLGDIASLAIYRPGEVFGTLALVGQDNLRTATVAALEAGETLALARTDFMILQRSHPQMREALDRHLAEVIDSLNNRLLDAYYLPAAARIKHCLEQLAGVYGPSVDGWIEIPLSQEHIAGLSGATRETTNRALRAEAARGTVKLGRGRIVISDAGVRTADPG